MHVVVTSGLRLCVGNRLPYGRGSVTASRRQMVSALRRRAGTASRRQAVSTLRRRAVTASRQQGAIASLGQAVIASPGMRLLDWEGAGDEEGRPLGRMASCAGAGTHDAEGHR